MNKTTTLRNWWLLAFAGPLLILLSACSSGGEEQVATIEIPTTSTDQSNVEESVDDGGLALAQCMRENGIDFPDPDPGGGFGRAVGDFDRGDPKFQEAMQECFELRPAGGPRDRSFDAEAQSQNLEIVKCLRENGWDIPDPKFDANGTRINSGEFRANLNDPDFREDRRECRELNDLQEGTS